MSEDELNKIRIGTLLETYSVKEISSLFTAIDKQILSLHECSSEDFLSLNNDFKILYKQSSTIANNVNTILNVFNTKRNKELYSNIHNFYDDLKSQFDIFDQKLQLSLEFLDQLSNQLRFVFFPLKNFGQNLMSLKYLLANLNLSLSESDNENGFENFRKIEERINKLKYFSERILRGINSLRKISKITYSNLTNIKDQNELNIEVFLNDIRDRINKIEEKYKKNEDCIPEIRKRSDKSAVSISDIIKKLQYQDIIKQKMEHIQQTHKDLINELEKFENAPNDEKHLNDKAKFFIRIRDIAGLQAAQLIQANKEYQSALEIIFNNFMQIGDNMKVISEMCGNINIEEKETEIKLFDHIIEKISETEANIKSRFEQNNKINKDISQIDYHLGQSDKSFNVIVNSSIELYESIEKYLSNVENIIDVSNQSKPIDQIRNLATEIKRNASVLIDVTSNLNPVKKRIENFISEFNNLTLSNDIEEIRGVVQELNTVRKDIDNKLKENHVISNQVIGGIKKSISEIKYYDFFESIIEEIISELNKINYKLKVDHNEDDNTMEENLRKLKEYYTMETEHKIHEQVSKGEDVDIDIEIDEDGDIEFF